MAIPKRSQRRMSHQSCGEKDWQSRHDLIVPRYKTESSTCICTLTSPSPLPSQKLIWFDMYRLYSSDTEPTKMNFEISAWPRTKHLLERFQNRRTVWSEDHGFIRQGSRKPKQFLGNDLRIVAKKTQDLCTKDPFKELTGSMSPSSTFRSIHSRSSIKPPIYLHVFPAIHTFMSTSSTHSIPSF